MSIRIKDIAEKANVSPATVSLVLNNKEGVGPETRERILELSKKMDYRGPMSKKTIDINADSICFLHIARHGHIVNRDHDVFIADYIEGMSQEVKEKNFSLKINTFKSTSIEHIITSVKDIDSAGIIVLGTELSFEDVKAFRNINIPIVFIDNYYKYLNFDFVDMNNEDSVEKIIQNFIENGHTKIGLITSSISTPNFKLREKAFYSSLKHHKLKINKKIVYTVDSTFDGAYQGIKDIVNNETELPTAFFCSNDIIACGSLKGFSEKGIRVPEDVSLIGFDNLPISAMTTPGLTTVDVCKVRMGKMAVQLLSDRITNITSEPPVKVLMGGKLIERKSVNKL